ncbi:MAG TPA: relaxase domain-containing protein [Mycobacteriales bacterium]|nr:relaxase domain-containing protein [Mycobacteriales bacterium]
MPGYDLTFSAPKGVSLLFALADPGLSVMVRRAHDAAVAAAVGYLEREAGACAAAGTARSGSRAAGSSPRRSGTGRAARGIRSCTRTCWWRT